MKNLTDSRLVFHILANQQPMDDRDKVSTRARVIAHPRINLMEASFMENPSPQIAQTLLTAAPIGMAAIDADGKLTWCNQALAALAGKPPATLVGMVESELLEYPQGAEMNVYFPATGRLAQRSASGGGVFYVDITERDKLAKQLQRYDTVDPVSGLLNAQAIAGNLEPLISRSRRYDNPLSVVTMAVGNIGTAADPHKAVVAVSQLLRDQLRWADMVGRDNEGRFVFVLPETDKDSAIALANKIAVQLGGLTILGGICRPEARFGIAQWTRGDDAGLLLKRSAEALDAATRQGNLANAG
jgi:GGDEF domain-containing protein